MAMINCRECGREISNESENCVYCGCSTVSVGDIDKRCIQCGAWLRNNYCLRCGYSAVKSKKTRKSMLIACLVIVALCLGGLFLIPVFFDDTAPANGVHQQTGITLSMFNKIETGMSYEEVCNIIGSTGILLSEVDLDMGAEYNTKMYMWESSNSLGNASITFQGDKVTMKTQFGLK